jgi:hypothetical protein
MRRLAVLLLLAACVPPPAAEPPHFLWTADAQSLDNPFPDQRLLVDGALTLRPRWYQPFLPPKAVTAKSASFFNKVGGQATRTITALHHVGGTLIRVSEPLDPDSIQGTVARLVREGDGWRVLERNVQVLHPRDVLAARNLQPPEGQPEYLFVRPHVPMPENSDGFLVLLKGAKTSSGVAFGRGTEWSANAPDLAPIAAALELPASDILLALPERSGDITSTPRALAAWAEANPATVTIPPHGVVPDENNGSRPVGLWRRTDSDWDTLSPWLVSRGVARPLNTVGTVIIGELAARDLSEANVIRADWAANPSLAPVVPLRFVLTLPTGTTPTGGWPVVMGQHGVGGRNTPRTGNTESYCLQWAEALARRGLGCVGIDAPSHGSRGVFTSFFSIDDLPALRDRFREMTFDLLQVERAVVTIDADGDGTSDVAPRVRYFGNSLGSIMGSGFLPVSNRVSSAVLNVPGAGLSNLIMSPNLQDLIGLLIVAQTDLPFDSAEYVASFPLFRVAAQPFFDPGDPINLAQALSPDLALLQQTGKGDLIIPYDTSVDLANAFKLPEAKATSGTAPVRAYMEVEAADFLPANEAAAYNGHNVMWDFTPIREQALKFLETDGRELTMP